MTLGDRIGQGRTAEVYAWGDGHVVKLFREGLEEAAEHEAAVTRAVCEAGLPAPAVEGVVEVDGRSGVVFARIDAPSMLWRMPSQPWLILRWVRIMADLQAAFHAHSAPGLPSQKDKLRPGIEAAERLPRETRLEILRRLDGLPDGDAICHGDFHPDNILLCPSGPIVIDWGGASSGDPAGDVGATSMLLKAGEPMPQTPRRRTIEWLRRAFVRLYLRRYCRRTGVSRAAVAAWELPRAASHLSWCNDAEAVPLMALVEERLAGNEEGHR